MPYGVFESGLGASVHEQPGDGRAVVQGCVVEGRATQVVDHVHLATGERA
jgi:hypothetical protein